MQLLVRKICVAVIAAISLLSTQYVFAESPETRIQRLARLHAGVRAEEAIRSVKRLQQTYGHYLSMGLWFDLAALFTENAVGQFPSGTIKGKVNLRKYYMQQAARTLPGLAQGQLNAHLLLQPIINLGADGKTARGTWHEMALLGKYGSSASWLGGVYENEYAMEKGVWKISRLSYFLQYSGLYEEWGLKAPPKWDIPYHFEAAHVGVTIPESTWFGFTLIEAAKGSFASP